MNKLTLIVAMLLSLGGQQLWSQCSITQGGAPVIATDFCTSELPIQFSGLPAGGLFSGPGLFSNGFFNPSAAILSNPVNPFTITYSAPNGCTTTLAINIHVPLQAVASPTIPSFVCANDEPVLLTGNYDNDGAVFIINGNTIIDDFDPAFWGSGPHEILYTYTQNVGVATCFSYDTVYINVLATPNTAFTGWLPQYCLSDAPTTLVPVDTDINGTFSGSAGITASNTFDPLLAGVGVHDIVYTYQDLSGICFNADTVAVTVIDTISTDFVSVGSHCFGGIDTLVYTGTPVGTGTLFDWSLDDATILSDDGDTLIVQWNSLGTHTAMLDVSGNVCAGSPIVHSFDVIGISVDAGENVTMTNATPIQLNATATSDGLGDISLAWSPNVTITCTDCAAPSVAPETSTTYYVTATNELGCMASDSVHIAVIRQRSLFVPNIFTPNGDGKNDDIKPLGNEIETLRFSIFDRWGSMVFRSTNISDAWDGTINSKAAAAGAYAYALEVTFSDGISDVYKGSITLVR